MLNYGSGLGVIVALGAFVAVGSSAGIQTAKQNTPAKPAAAGAKIKCYYCGEENKAGAEVCFYCFSGVNYAKNPIPTPLAESPDYDTMPSWGPNGKIAYTCSKQGDGLWTMNGDGSGKVGLPHSSDSFGDFDSCWAPDGKIVFSGGTVTKDLFTMDPDGGNRTKITDYVGDETGPSVNAEGKIVFSCDVDQPGERGFNLFIVDRDGSNRVQVTKNGTFNFSPCWSPDGKKIAYNATVGDRGYYGTSEIFVMDADGSNVKQLTTNPADDTDPSWGPDGRIAFTSDRDDKKGEIYVMNADGSGLARVTVNRWLDHRPSLGPDGKLIFESDPGYKSPQGSQRNIYLVKLKK